MPAVITELEFERRSFARPFVDVREKLFARHTTERSYSERGGQLLEGPDADRKAEIRHRLFVHPKKGGKGDAHRDVFRIVAT